MAPSRFSVEWEIPSASLKSGISLRLKNGCAQDDLRGRNSVKKWSPALTALNKKITTLTK